nr:DUF3883 domain-containing protein [uncultured Flavobacterium sp.]
MGYKSRTENSINNNNLKLTADKVIQVLDQVREEGQKSKRRWIWELMQNAKDVPNKYDKVSIEITLRSNELIFAHNGDAFTIDNLTGIVQQVSSKHSKNSNEDVTGKFGTGFIATHLLSDIIFIEGVLQDEGELPKLFELELDRSGKSSEELMPSIEKTLNILNNIEEESSFITFTEYDKIRTEQIFYNKFKYLLNSEDSIKTAKTGLDDLKTTLPAALVFLPMINQVRIIDEINNSDILYKTTKSFSSISEYEEFSISIKDIAKDFSDNLYYIVKTKNKIQLLAQVENFSNYNLIEINEKQPFIYRDFPLIGTENFFFPFIVNGKLLDPTERRDSIFLNGVTEKVKNNRCILEDAIQYSLEFVDFLIEKNAGNLYNTCLSSLPEYNFDEESDTKNWFINNIQHKYRSNLINKKILGGEYTLNDIRFPSSDEKNSPELRTLITQYLGEKRVPHFHKQEIWLYFLGPKSEMITWGIDLTYGIHDLLKDIDDESETFINKVEFDSFEWLNKLYLILHDINESSLHLAYKLVPNHYGKLQKFSSLFNEEIAEDDSSFLPLTFLNLLKKLGEDWFEDIIHRKVTITKKDHQKRRMSDLNTAINNFFRKDDFLSRPDSHLLLLNVHSIVAPGSKEDSFQRTILSVANEIYRIEEKLEREEYSSKYFFDIAHRLLISSINKEIEQLESILGLSSKINKDEIQTTIWLNNYLRAIAKSSFSNQIKERKIIPNRQPGNIFCNFDYILNYGLDEQPLDHNLLLILAGLDNEKNYFGQLIADGIDVKMANSLTFERLANEVIKTVERIDYEKLHDQHRENLLELIDWVERNPTLITKYAPVLNLLSSRIFYILTIEKNQNREDVMKILKNTESISILASISQNTHVLNQIKLINDLFPTGIPEKVLEFAKEEERKKKDFNNMLDIGSEVEKLLISTLQHYKIEVNHEIIYAGGGPYDIRIYNSINNKSYYIEVKSVRYKNEDPINMAISQVKRAVKEKNKFALLVVERPQDKSDLTPNYIEKNSQFVKNAGDNLLKIEESFNIIEESSNTGKNIDLKMLNAEFKCTIDYEIIKNNTHGFLDLIAEIENILSDN